MELQRTRPGGRVCRSHSSQGSLSRQSKGRPTASEKHVFWAFVSVIAQLFGHQQTAALSGSEAIASFTLGRAFCSSPGLWKRLLASFSSRTSNNVIIGAGTFINFPVGSAAC